MNRFIYLATGLVITILFIVMSYSQNNNIFEMLYFNQGFNDQLYNLSVYPTVAMIVAAVAWAGAAVYYFVINSVKFDRWYHWAGVLGVVTLVTPIVCYAFINGVLSDNGLDYAAESMQFIMQLFIMTAVLFTVASFSMRSWSTNCRHTPFPQ